jgi:ribonuclease P/MRP protein subunit RPP40
MVPRERLLAKLESKGISGTVLSWLREWLTGRKQRVVWSLEKKSQTGKMWTRECLKAQSWAPVHSMCVFIDDLEEEITRIDPEIILLKFADDSKLARDVSSENNRRKLQDALDKLCEWASKWGISFNVKKCKVMHIGHANKKGDYNMEGQTLGKTTEEKDIGVLVTGDLKPSNHCAKKRLPTWLRVFCGRSRKTSLTRTDSHL